jgi:hypothetical protein
MQNPDEMMASAITAFKQWRDTRVNRAVKTPTILQAQASSLLKHFPSSKITVALSISGTNLKRWSTLVQDGQSLTEFVALPPLEAPSSAPLSMQVVFNNGCHLRLCGELSPAQLTAITQSVAASSREIS